MTVDLSPCFTADELPLATRLLAARAQRLNAEAGAFFRAAARDIVFDEAGRGTPELTEAVVAAAEVRAAEAVTARVSA